MATATGPLTTGHREGEIMPIALAASVQIYKGAAAAVVLGTGYGTPLVATNPLHQFVGVFSESILSSSTVGGTSSRIMRKGCWSFGNPNSIGVASIGEPAYFADDNNITLTEGTTYAGTIVAVDAAGLVWIDIEDAVRTPSLGGRDWTAITASGAVNPHVTANYIITKAGVAALTLAAPTAVTDDGTEIVISSSTLFAHTLTATGLLSTGTSAVNLATFAAFAGAGLTLKAYNGLWQVKSSVGITFS